MGAQALMATTPGTLVRAPSSYGLHYRINVTNGAGGATLASLLPGGVLPRIPVPNVSGPAGQIYTFGYVELQAETDPATIAVRYTCDGQTTPTATVGCPASFAFLGAEAPAAARFCFFSAMASSS